MCQKAVLQGFSIADLLTLSPHLLVGKPDLAPSSMNVEDNQATAHNLPFTSGTLLQQGIDTLDPKTSTSSQVERHGIAPAGHDNETAVVTADTSDMDHIQEQAQDTPISTTPPYLFTTPEKRPLPLPPLIPDPISGLFRADGYINFERDFGQWFSDSDGAIATSSNMDPSMAPPSPSTLLAPWPQHLLTPSQQFSVTDMFSTEFMQSVANQLEDFDSNLFRPDEDINFERDFGQWFTNPEDVDGTLDMRP